MKRFIFFAHVFTWLTFAIPLTVQAQNNDPYLNYVVIGAFASQNNAIHFTEDANSHNFPAHFEINPNRNLFYVYVLTIADRKFAFEEALKLRNETKYFDTWVYSGLLGKFEVKTSLHQDMDINPATEQKMESIGVEQNAALAGKTNATTTLDGNGSNDRESGITTEQNPATTIEQTSTPATEPPKPLSAENVIGKNLFFKLFRASNNAVVEGDVDAVDSEKSRRMATYKGNTPVKVLMPAGKSQHVSFVCEVFGYRKLQKEFDPNNPSEELSLDENGNLVMPFELVRLQKGDIAIMYNVFFFKDAAVMRPESRYEVNNLLELLNENPSYKIKIHGHTNGNANGKILSMDKSGNFFSLTNTKEGIGSAKKLSEERALIMKEYLISNGIEQGRMQIKAWGGKRPIHDKNAVRAQENVRVEIEILTE